MDMRDYFKVGDRIGNYCNGYFGRDDYYNKACVMVTEKYAVFEAKYKVVMIIFYIVGVFVLTTVLFIWFLLVNYKGGVL